MKTGYTTPSSRELEKRSKEAGRIPGMGVRGKRVLGCAWSKERDIFSKKCGSQGGGGSRTGTKSQIRGQLSGGGSVKNPRKSLHEEKTKKKNREKRGRGDSRDGVEEKGVVRETGNRGPSRKKNKEAYSNKV